MKVRFGVLGAAAFAVLPAAAAAQVTGSRVNPGDNPAAERARSSVDRSSAEADPAFEAPAEAGATVLAEPADFRAGAEVRDTAGDLVGTIEAVERDGAVVATGSVRAKLPLSSFGKNGRGLVISLSRAELEAAARARGGG